MLFEVVLAAALAPAAAPAAPAAVRAMPEIGTMGVHAARRNEDDSILCWSCAQDCWEKQPGGVVGTSQIRVGRGEFEADRNRGHDHAGIM